MLYYVYYDVGTCVRCVTLYYIIDCLLLDCLMLNYTTVRSKVLTTYNVMVFSSNGQYTSFLVAS